MLAECAADPVPLPPKSPFWPPTNLLQRPYGPDPIPADLAGELEWFKKTVLDELPLDVKQPDTEFALTEEEEKLILMSLPTWQKARMQGEYTCSQMASALTKRAMYVQKYQKMNHFMYWKDDIGGGDGATAQARSTVFDWVAVVRKQASDMDNKAVEKGVEALAPLYCYPVPLKGTWPESRFSSVPFPCKSKRLTL